jgi:hypothetical protein
MHGETVKFSIIDVIPLNWITLYYILCLKWRQRILDTQQSLAALSLRAKDSRSFALKLCSLHIRYSAIKFSVLVVSVYLAIQKFCPLSSSANKSPKS